MGSGQWLVAGIMIRDHKIRIRSHGIGEVVTLMHTLLANNPLVSK